MRIAEENENENEKEEEEKEEEEEKNEKKRRRKGGEKGRKINGRRNFFIFLRKYKKGNQSCSGVKLYIHKELNTFNSGVKYDILFMSCMKFCITRYSLYLFYSGVQLNTIGCIRPTPG